jgi:hypothetical protein
MLAAGVTRTLRFLREQVGGTLEQRVMAAQTAPARRGKNAWGMGEAAGRRDKGRVRQWCCCVVWECSSRCMLTRACLAACMYVCFDSCQPADRTGSGFNPHSLRVLK